MFVGAFSTAERSSAACSPRRPREQPTKLLRRARFRLAPDPPRHPEQPHSGSRRRPLRRGRSGPPTSTLRPRGTLSASPLWIASRSFLLAPRPSVRPGSVAGVSPPGASYDCAKTGTQLPKRTITEARIRRLMAQFFLTMHRKSMWLMEVSTGCAWRAAGR